MSILLASLFLVNGTTAFAQEPSLSASIRNTDLLKPVLVLTNTSSKQCQVVQSAIGTVSVTKAIQDGKEISPLPITVAFDDGLEVQLANKLQTIQPGKSIEIPLQIVPYKDGQALQSITWSKETGAFGTIYPLTSNKPYSLGITYVAPITGTNGIPMCGIVMGKSDSAFDTASVIKPAGIIGGIILLVMIIIWLFRLKKHKHVAKVIILIVVLLSSSSGINRQVQADYSVPSSAVGQFDECMALLDRYPDITGPVLDALDSGHIILYVNHSAENYATDWPDGTYHIHWDAFNTYNYYSDDGSVIVSTPCDRLFHEMYHVYEMMKGINDRHYCNGSGLEINEVEATRAQNRLREAMGLLPRTHYGTERLPAGECTAPPVVIPTCTGASCGESTGEPHLKTFDHLRYDFQAIGEFIAARDPKGDFEIQTRQEPWPGSRDVSMNTAVAMQVGTNRVEVQMYQQEMALLINGKRQPLEKITMDGGGTIVPINTPGWIGINAVTLTWPDKSAVIVNRVGNFGLDIIVAPAPLRAGKLEGLLGNYNGDSKDDLKLKGDTTTIEPDFEKLYPGYADSWRVDDHTSLFTYTPGENAKTYTDRTFPDKSVSVKDLPNRTAAEALCKSFGVIVPEILKNCIFDIVLTGRPEFARSTSLLQQMTQTDYGGQTFILTVTKPGETASVSFEGKANEKIFLNISKATFSYQCGGLGIKDPKGEPIATGCIANGGGFVDTTQLPVTGTYSIFIDPTNQQIGQATLQLIKVINFKANITPDGSALTAKLSQPGSVAELSFSGIAGQKVFVDFSKGTIPDQCGGISLQAPDGSLFGSVCLSNGAGVLDEKGTVLPTTGTYKVSIDPSEKNTGEITVRVHR